jgi:5'-deoxynucleotidase YfbR-like HD superfamily hydrolase
VSITVSILDNKSIDLLNLDVEKIQIDHIATALSNICRFNGMIKSFYSVAQHSCFCVDLAYSEGETDPEFLLSVLLHDASEAYTGDIIKPIKIVLGEKFKLIEDSVSSSISKKFNIDLEKNHDKIKIYDTMAYEVEKHLKNNNCFECWSQKKSKKKFLKEFNKYAKHICPNQ